MVRSARRPPVVALTAALLALGVLTAAPAAAVPCALDEPPAATLLLPYFEVDPDGAATTLVSIANAEAAPAMTRVTLWSDLGVPVLSFHVYLTGLDVQTINLRDVLAGRLPQTATPAADPGDEISPQGELSEEADFPGCAAVLPPLEPSAAEVAHLRAALSGQPSPLDGACYGLPWLDGLARGWLTVDVVLTCEEIPPAADAYTPSGGLGFANVLWGDWALVDAERDHAAGGNLVRLEADPTLFGAERTFYSTWTGGTGSDAREPLPSVWAARYGLHSGGGTDLLYWRDPGEVGAPFDCALSQHPWFPLAGEEPLVFDEEENVFFSDGCGVTTCPPLEPLSPFFAQSGRVEVGGADLPVAFQFGWMYAELGLSGEPLQGLLTTVAGAEGRYSVAGAATPLDRPCAPGREEPGS